MSRVGTLSRAARRGGHALRRAGRGSGWLLTGLLLATPASAQTEDAGAAATTPAEALAATTIAAVLVEGPTTWVRSPVSSTSRSPGRSPLPESGSSRRWVLGGLAGAGVGLLASVVWWQSVQEADDDSLLNGYAVAAGVVLGTLIGLGAVWVFGR